MRDSVNNKEYKKRRELELVLEKKFRDKFIPRYSMVSFHQIPYSKVYKRGQIQLDLMNRYLSNELTKAELYDQIDKQLEPIR
jgi:kynurenine 3-monooxygenase